MSADWDTVGGQLPYDAKELEGDGEVEYIIMFNNDTGDHYEVSYIFDIKEVEKRIQRYLTDGTIKDGKYVVIERTVHNKVVMQKGFEIK